MKTISELKKYILAEYGISPESEDETKLVYRAITFEHGGSTSVFVDKKESAMWGVHRHGHTIDFMTPEELSTQVNPAGSLLYWFFPLDRMQ